ncbi:patatin-like phospholipase family protein [Hyunsoonleella ulvae]|uniref:patatin-like phospholipase family protein n=1 Tax=Hyunsoonleella ulvae TaxID=2799948 RepID=UPI00193A46F1|nr:patatin-like phospholipase family protein [Hyunsoonleella ulvae]
MSSNEDILRGIELITHFHENIRPKITDKNFLQISSEWFPVVVKYNNRDLDEKAIDLILDVLTELNVKNLRAAKELNKTLKRVYKSLQRALIMKGGGIKGLSYVGALKELEKYYSFNWYAGTSAGAISAILLASGFTNNELEKVLKNKNFNDFKDASSVKKWFNLLIKHGFYTAHTFSEWLNDLLNEKFDKYYQIKLKDIYKITGNRITVFASRRFKSAVVFDSNNNEKNNSATFAVRCSMSIPFIFTPQRENGFNVYDGGLQNNFPIDKILEDSPYADFLGLYLGSEKYKLPQKQNAIISMIKDLVSLSIEKNDYEVLRKHENKIIIIDTDPISVLKFNLSEEEKKFLIEAGSLGVLNYLDKQGKISKNNFNYHERKKNHEEIRKSLIQKNKKSKLIKRVKIIVIIALIILIVIFRRIFIQFLFSFLNLAIKHFILFSFLLIDMLFY